MSETIDLEITTERLQLLDDFQHFAIEEFGGGNILPSMIGVSPNTHFADASPDRQLALIQILEILIDLCGERSKAFRWLIDNACYRGLSEMIPIFALKTEARVLRL